jgi:hypothetical protein
MRKGISNRYAHILAREIIRQKGIQVSQPWSAEGLCADIALTRGRRIDIISIDVPGFPTGAVISDADCDVIGYRAGLTGFYRDHVILHELCHLLCGHGVPLRKDERLVDAVANHSYTFAEEHLAEAFATTVLTEAHHRTVPTADRHVSALFGV